MATALLQKWLEDRLPGIPVQLVAEGDAPRDRVCVALCDIGASSGHSVRADPVARPQRSRPLRIALTYRITAPFADIAQSHDILSEILVSAMDTPLLVREGAAPVPLAVVPAATMLERLGPQPGIGLYLELTVTRDGPVRTAPPVHEAVLRPAPKPLDP